MAAAATRAEAQAATAASSGSSSDIMDVLSSPDQLIASAEGGQTAV